MALLHDAHVPRQADLETSFQIVSCGLRVGLVHLFDQSFGQIEQASDVVVREFHEIPFIERRIYFTKT